MCGKEPLCIPEGTPERLPCLGRDPGEGQGMTGTGHGQVEIAQLAAFAANARSLVVDAVDADPAAALALAVHDKIKTGAAPNPHFLFAGAAIESVGRRCTESGIQAETASVVAPDPAARTLGDLDRLPRDLAAPAADRS